VDEGPRGPGAGRAPNGAQQGSGGAFLEPGREFGAGQGPLGHQPVDVRVAGRERAVGGHEGRQRIVGPGDGQLERGGRLLETGGDDGALERGLVRQVLVQRRGADAQFVRDPPHRQGLRALPLRQSAGDGDDLPGAGGQRVTHVARSRPAA
jgi:hypothetical protein